MRHLLGLAVVGLVCAGGAAAQKAGGGEPFFPRSGNHGYDVSHYDVQLAYQPGSGEAAGDRDDRGDRRPAACDRFSLDLDGLRVTGVSSRRRAGRASPAAAGS